MKSIPLILFATTAMLFGAPVYAQSRQSIRANDLRAKEEVVRSMSLELVSDLETVSDMAATQVQLLRTAASKSRARTPKLSDSARGQLILSLQQASEIATQTVNPVENMAESFSETALYSKESNQMQSISVSLGGLHSYFELAISEAAANEPISEILKLAEYKHKDLVRSMGLLLYSVHDSFKIFQITAEDAIKLQRFYVALKMAFEKQLALVPRGKLNYLLTDLNKRELALTPVTIQFTFPSECEALMVRKKKD